eukprot:3302900-Pyramimonas_sp.AAC.3
MSAFDLGDLGGLVAPQEAPLPLQLRAPRGARSGVEGGQVLDCPLHLHPPHSRPVGQYIG